MSEVGLPQRYRSLADERHELQSHCRKLGHPDWHRAFPDISRTLGAALRFGVGPNGRVAQGLGAVRKHRTAPRLSREKQRYRRPEKADDQDDECRACPPGSGTDRFPPNLFVGASVAAPLVTKAAIVSVGIVLIHGAFTIASSILVLL